MPSADRSLALTRRQRTGLGVAALSIAFAGLAIVAATSRRTARAQPGRRDVNARAARSLNAAAATLGSSVLLDSTVEHHRGMFANRTMVMPLGVSALAVAASLQGAAGGGGRSARGGVDTLAILTGAVGFGFHLRNVHRSEGGWSWQNLFYGAPVGAPIALSIAGVLGVAADRVRYADGPARIAGLPAGPALAGLAAFGILGSAGEAGLLHFRGAFQNPAMFVPITVPPVAAGVLAAAALRPDRPGLRSAARWTLRATAVVGIAGVAFHAYGVSRMMGGWYNWSQNLIDGPPLPAPPAFTGLAIAGLAALDLMEPRHG